MNKSKEMRLMKLMYYIARCEYKQGLAMKTDLVRFQRYYSRSLKAKMSFTKILCNLE